jgi:hypothetical protein
VLLEYLLCFCLSNYHGHLLVSPNLDTDAIACGSGGPAVSLSSIWTSISFSTLLSRFIPYRCVQSVFLAGLCPAISLYLPIPQHPPIHACSCRRRCFDAVTIRCRVIALCGDSKRLKLCCRLLVSPRQKYPLRHCLFIRRGEGEKRRREREEYRTYQRQIQREKDRFSSVSLSLLSSLPLSSFLLYFPLYFPLYLPHCSSLFFSLLLSPSVFLSLSLYSLLFVSPSRSSAFDRVNLSPLSFSLSFLSVSSTVVFVYEGCPQLNLHGTFLVLTSQTGKLFIS